MIPTAFSVTPPPCFRTPTSKVSTPTFQGPALPSWLSFARPTIGATLGVQKLEDTSYLCKKNTLWLDFCFKWTGQIHDIIDLEIFGGHLISSNKKKHKISANRLRLGPCGDFDLEPPALISTPSWWVFSSGPRNGKKMGIIPAFGCGQHDVMNYGSCSHYDNKNDESEKVVTDHYSCSML
jgi:hypothetical protein